MHDVTNVQIILYMDVRKILGAWTHMNVIDYVVFPVGLTLDPDNYHVWLSYGRQVKSYVSTYIHTCVYICIVCINIETGLRGGNSQDRYQRTAG